MKKRSVDPKVAAAVRGPFSGARVRIDWKFDASMREDVSRFNRSLIGPVVEASLAPFAEARLDAAKLRRCVPMLDHDGAANRIYGRPIFLPSEMVRALDALVTMYKFKYRAQIIEAAVREHANRMYPVVEAAEEIEVVKPRKFRKRGDAAAHRKAILEAAWKQNQADQEQFAKEDAEEMAKFFKAKGVKGREDLEPASLMQTDKGRILASKLGFAVGCQHEKMDEEAAKAGEYVAAACKALPATNVCAACKKRFCDACFEADETSSGECPECDEEPGGVDHLEDVSP